VNKANMPLPSELLTLREGRPNEPCPYRATGLLSQEDLMLCNKREEFRSPRQLKASEIRVIVHSRSSEPTQIDPTCMTSY